VNHLWFCHGFASIAEDFNMDAALGQANRRGEYGAPELNGKRLHCPHCLTIF
jgi:hypothetical protein